MSSTRPSLLLLASLVAATAALAGCSDRGGAGAPTEPSPQLREARSTSAEALTTTSGLTYVASLTSPMKPVVDSFVYIGIRATFYSWNGSEVEHSALLQSPPSTDPNYPIILSEPLFGSRIHQNTTEYIVVREYRSYNWAMEGTYCGEVIITAADRGVKKRIPASSAACRAHGQADSLSAGYVTLTWDTVSYTVASITTSNVTTDLGAGTATTPKAYASNGTPLSGRTFAGSVADPTIASISCTTSCTLTGRKGGQTTYTVTADGASATATVTVRAPASISISPTSPSVHVGSTVSLSATVRDASGNVLATPVTWQSANTALATVNSAGVVTGVAPGVVTVTASAGGVSSSVQVTVLANIAMSGPAYAYNQNATVTATVTPTGTYYYVWTFRFCSNSTLPSDCDFTWYPGTQGTNDVSFTEFIFPRDYWVDFRVEVRASQNGPSLGTATYRVDGAGEGDGGGCSPCLVSRPDSSADR